MKKITLCLLMLLPLLSNATMSIHRISTPYPLDANKDFNSEVIDGHFIFQSLSSNTLWISDGKMSNTHQLLNNELSIKLNESVNSMVKFNNWLYYIDKNAGNTLWRTDGVDFIQVSNLSLDSLSGITQKNRRFYVMSLSHDALLELSQDALVEVVSNYLVQLDMQSFCNVGDTVYIRAKESSNAALKLYKIVENSPIEFNSGIDFELMNFLPELTMQSDMRCFYAYEPQISIGNIRKFIAVNSAGVVENISTEIGNQINDDWQTAFIFNGNAYFYPFSPIAGNYHRFLYVFNDGNMEEIQQAIADGFIIDVSVTDSYFSVITPYRFSGDPIPPILPTTRNQVFNTNLELVSDNASYQSRFLLKNHLDQTFVIYIDDAIIFNDKQQSQEYSQQTIDVSAYEMSRISLDSDATYFIGTAKSNPNQSFIFKASNQTVVSTQMSGLWVAEGLQSQGLSIHTGTREDDSTYMFVSLYLYKDGTPFWVAGNSDYEAGDSSVSFNLSEYRGSSFIPNDSGQESQRFDFGTLLLTPVSCTTLSADFSLLEADVNLDYLQIRDKSNTGICLD